MTAEAPSRLPAPYWSWPGLLEGARLCGAMIPGTAVFAAAYGTLAAQKGLTLSEAVLMSTLVFGGSAQLVALEVWNVPITFATVLSLTAVTAMVNSRLILMGATLRPWLGNLPPWQAYLALSTTVDATWLIGMRYRSEGGGDASVFVGAGLTPSQARVSADVRQRSGLLDPTPRGSKLRSEAGLTAVAKPTISKRSIGYSRRPAPGEWLGTVRGLRSRQRRR